MDVFHILFQLTVCLIVVLFVPADCV